MRRNILSGALLFLSVLPYTGLGQTMSKCPKLIEKDYPTYKIGQSDIVKKDGTDTMLLLYISISPSILNRDSMVKLTERIKNDFCNEKRIQVVIFDKYKVARRFISHPHSKTYKYDMKSMKGGYFLDRISGQEYVSFSAVGEGMEKEKKIMLGGKREVLNKN